MASGVVPTIVTEQFLGSCLPSPSGSNRRINSGIRRILCRGTPKILALRPLHWCGSGRGDNPYGGSRINRLAMRINLIQRHASTHAFPQRKIGRCHSKHSAKGSCQVCRIGKPSIMSSCGYTGASHQVAACPPQTEPENIWPKRNSRRLGENVHEARLR